MDLKDYWNPICIAVSALMILSAVMLFAIVLPAIGSFSDLGCVCTSIIGAGMGVCFILFMSIYFDRRISDSVFYIMCLLSAVYFSLCVEYCYWLAVDLYHNISMLNAVYHLEHLILPPILYLFINYEMEIMDLEKGFAVKYKWIALTLMTIEVVLTITNYLTGYAFYPDGPVYVNTFFWWTLTIPTVLLSLICIYLALCHATTTRHRNALFVCILIPLVTGVLSLPFHVPSFTTLSLVAVGMVVYGEIYQDRGMKILKNDAALTEHKVAVMVSRIEPELLDEALSNIMEMGGNPSETVEAISKFKTYLGENISTISQTAPIPFEKELEHVMTYVGLEKLRFKDKIDVVFVTPDRDFKVPPMTLQMIVENAIKHGITQKEEGGTVTIITEELENAHRITITDNGVGFDTDAPTDTGRSHVGLENLSSRLKTMMGGTFEIKSKVGAGTTAVVLIPKR